MKIRSHYKKVALRNTQEDMQRYERYRGLQETKFSVPADYSTFLSVEDFVFAELALLKIKLAFPNEPPEKKEITVEDHIMMKRREMDLTLKIRQKEEEIEQQDDKKD